jgi:hypothetical protein
VSIIPSENSMDIIKKTHEGMCKVGGGDRSSSQDLAKRLNALLA